MSIVYDMMHYVFPKNLTNDDVFFVCIGTDRSTGDSLGAFVGTFLKRKGYKNIVGTIDDPVHAKNLHLVNSLLPKDKTIVAIDACLGRLSSVGEIIVGKGKIKPGAGVGKELTEIGDYHILGIVNVKSDMDYFVLKSTRLSLVLKMAQNISGAITKRFPLDVKKGWFGKLYKNKKIKEVLI